MSLIARLEDELKQAMVARDQSRRDALRLILSSLRSAEKELQRPLHDDEELQVLQRERKRRLEAAEAFRGGGREEQALGEEQELAVLEEFMPAPLSDDEELQVLQRERKRRIEAAEAFRSGGREEQAASEERELAVLQEFMPEPLSEDELEEIVDDAIAENGATGMSDFGRVMADVMPQISGRADGSVVSQIVKEKLA